VETRTIRQSVTFMASTREVYEVLMDSRRHSKFTGDKAIISRNVGGRFRVGDDIQGVNLELAPGQRIVQSWRGSDWPEGHFSRAVFTLKSIGRGTRLTFTQIGVPEENYDEIWQGWHDYYWTPVKGELDASGRTWHPGLTNAAARASSA
jgi:activator of HSP90 ATPase